MPFERKIPQMSLRLIDIADKASFLSELKHIEKEVLSEKHYPIIHIDVHGDENGIEVSSGEVIKWSELQPYLRNINIACCNELLVVLAACKGANLYKVFLPIDRATLWCLIGADEDILGHDVRDSFQAFYEELLTSGDFGKALNQLNNAFPNMPLIPFLNHTYNNIFYLTPRQKLSSPFLSCRHSGLSGIVFGLRM
ncbi:MAG: hypothetical protein HQK95_04210, partial [Nitrospirae bacterium]|nr:hypothetical protein [Nitrospirota bacterium]